MEDFSCSKKFHKYCCISCDYYTSRKSQYDRHLTTVKHLKVKTDYMDYNLVPNVKFSCLCGSEYKYRQGLWKHLKFCKKNKSSESSVAQKQDEYVSKEETQVLREIVKDLIKHNQELTNKIIDICKTPAINNSNLNSNNKTFNLHFFLNETCKDAMNISEFVDSIKFKLKDLEHIGEVGFVNGISDVVLDNLTELDTKQRPIHCSDQKREILYIKDNDEWIKDDESNTKMTQVVKQIAHKNIKIIPEWVRHNPDCRDSSSKKNDKYLKIVSNSMSGGTELEQKTNISKIISKVAKEVTINKNIYQ